MCQANTSMVWHFAASLACLIAGIICLALVRFGVVTGGMSLLLIVLASINLILSVVIIVEARKKR
ncbi:MAG: hypothetical protein ACKVQS_03900 [Fimbriimonadaceae bacterium]